MPSLVGDPEQIRAMYESGMTQREIADVLGVYRSYVHRAMCRSCHQKFDGARRRERGEHRWRRKREAA